MAWNCDYTLNPPYYGYYTAGFPTAVCMGTEMDSSATQSPLHPSPPAGTDSEDIDANIPTA